VKTKMNRRDFLFLRRTHEDIAELSCEQLFMRCVDSTLGGTTAELFGSIEQSLTSVRTVHLTDPEWLSCTELEPLVAILSAFRRRGGLVETVVTSQHLPTQFREHL
jgi:hypothetical protein